jgi:type VI secretion system protein ImpC
LEFDESLQLYLVDVSKARLQQQLLGEADSVQDITASRMYQSLVEQTVQTLGGEPWSLLVGLYDFTAVEADVRCLEALAQLAHAGGGPFLAAADDHLLGCESPAVLSDPKQWQALTEEAQAAWDSVRDHPYASWLGLVFPRFLLRLPYGTMGETTERFEFEEFPSDMALVPRHERYLWGNGALVAAVLIAQSFQQNGWSMQPGDVLELDDLPWYVYEVDGEKTVLPCAEALLSERTAERIESHGVMALMSYKDRNAVRLWRFRSLARQNPGLAGAWGA